MLPHVADPDWLGAYEAGEGGNVSGMVDRSLEMDRDNFAAALEWLDRATAHCRLVALGYSAVSLSAPGYGV